MGYSLGQRILGGVAGFGLLCVVFFGVVAGMAGPQASKDLAANIFHLGGNGAASTVNGVSEFGVGYDQTMNSKAKAKPKAQANTR